MQGITYTSIHGVYEAITGGNHPVGYHRVSGFLIVMGDPP